MKIRVYVKIGRREGLLGWDGERLTVGVNAPPVDGAANVRLIEILSKWLGENKNDIQIIKGHTARYKTLNVHADTEHFSNLVQNLPRLPKQQKLL